MTVTLTWICDWCAATITKDLRDPKPLVTPDGWAVYRDGDGYRHACPSCTPPASEDRSP